MFRRCRDVRLHRTELAGFTAGLRTWLRRCLCRETSTRVRGGQGGKAAVERQRVPFASRWCWCVLAL